MSFTISCKARDLSARLAEIGEALRARRRSQQGA